MIQSAFEVLDAPTSMIRFTFIVGGGKLVRGKYAEELPKWMNVHYENAVMSTIIAPQKLWILRGHSNSNMIPVRI